MDQLEMALFGDDKGTSMILAKERVEEKKLWVQPIKAYLKMFVHFFNLVKKKKMRILFYVVVIML